MNEKPEVGGSAIFPNISDVRTDGCSGGGISALQERRGSKAGGRDGGTE